MRQSVQLPDLTELQTFCVAAEMGTLGRAARRLHVSQPALSKRLANLERATGTRLLERSPRGVTLTAAGKRVYEDARRLVEHAQALGELMGALQTNAPPLFVAASHTVTESLLSDALVGLDAGGHHAQLMSANSSVVRQLVADGRADIGIAAAELGQTPDPRLHELPLTSDDIVVAVPTSHPWARRSSITQHEFLSTAMVLRDPAANSRATVDAILQARGLSAAPPLAEVGTTLAVKAQARERRAPCLLSATALDAAGNLVAVPVDGLCFRREFRVVLPTPTPDARTRAFVQHLRAHAIPPAARA